MSSKKSENPASLIIDLQGIKALLDVLSDKPYEIIGPKLGESSIIYGRINGVEDLPAGYIDRQEGGEYRLEKTADSSLFSYVVGPMSWKRFLYPPEQSLVSIKSTVCGFDVEEEVVENTKRVFFGVRSCDISAIRIQDRILMDGKFADRTYAINRDNTLIIAVNCTCAGGTCFCASMGTGPRAKSGFDIALTELELDGEFVYVAEAGSTAGATLLDSVPSRETDIDLEKLVVDATDSAAEQMGRELDTTNIRDLLAGNFEHPRWEEVASRCLTCGNCTLVCPTCFCVNVKDSTDLDGKTARRLRKWDSCFTLDHSYIYGGSIRTSASARYRQWITHKLGYWIDQFGTSGCVGCGRCITWCPVGIDITEEAAAIRRTSRVDVTESDEAVTNGES